jgi:hypothetical protein
VQLGATLLRLAGAREPFLWRFRPRVTAGAGLRAAALLLPAGSSHAGWPGDMAALDATRRRRPGGHTASRTSGFVRQPSAAGLPLCQGVERQRRTSPTLAFVIPALPA